MTPSANTDHFDVGVVGLARPVWSWLHLLAEHGLRVLVLERGADHDGMARPSTPTTSASGSSSEPAWPTKFTQPRSATSRSAGSAQMARSAGSSTTRAHRWTG